ncbi:hypothetical protein DL98DRAFT_589731 [Cadophora sp. DSE1049]|nr:hypothetical protein DL98DRAFT_589731 [Cadophora sp. DSE1049]
MSALAARMDAMSAPSGSSAPQPAPSLEPTPYKPRIRRNFPRSKLGCSTCRSRRKKCDERVPTCQNCERRKVPCCWPAGRSTTPPKPSKEQRATEDVVDILQTNQQDTGTRHKSSRSNPQIVAVHLKDLVSSGSSVTNSKASTNPWYMQKNLSNSSCFLLSPSSRILFDRYVSQTSKDLGATTKASNPFVGYVIPLALSDKLYMDCILALSGSDLSVDEMIDPSSMSATWSHYSHAVRGLHCQLSYLAPGNIQQALHLLFLTLGLMHVELLSCAPTHLIFPHLIASRHLIHNILSASSLLTDQTHVSLFGYLFELYSVRVLGGSVHRPEHTETRVSYGILELEFFLGSFVSTTQYPFYSANFGSGGHLLAAFAPPVASFVKLQSGLSCDSERSDHNDSVLRDAYDSLAGRLRLWKLPQANQDFDISPARATASMIYQNALLIYLHTIFLPTATTRTPAAIYSEILSEIQMRVEICLPLLTSLYPSRMEGVILWPSMIFGSCLKKQEDIAVLRAGMSKARYKLRTVRWVREVLERLWSQGNDACLGSDQEEGHLWGPKGLAKIVAKGLD